MPQNAKGADRSWRLLFSPHVRWSRPALPGGRSAQRGALYL